MSGKKSFLVYYDSPAFEMLDDSQLGRLVRMMLAFDAQGEEPPIIDDAKLEAVWLVTRSQLARDARRYESRCEVNRANGRKGGLAKATNRKRSPQSLANLADTETDTETDTDTATETDKGKSAKAQRPRPSKTFKPPTIEEVQAFADARGLKLDAADFCDYYAAQGWKLSNGNMMKDWEAAARRWATRSFANRGTGKGGGQHVYVSDYD